MAHYAVLFQHDKNDPLNLLNERIGAIKVSDTGVVTLFGGFDFIVKYHDRIALHTQEELLSYKMPLVKLFNSTFTPFRFLIGSEEEKEKNFNKAIAEIRTNVPNAKEKVVKLKPSGISYQTMKLRISDNDNNG